MLKTNPTDRLTAKEVVERLKYSSLVREFSDFAINDDTTSETRTTRDVDQTETDRMKSKILLKWPFTKMAALGRRFQLGALYDYRTDSILLGNKLFKYFRLTVRKPIGPFDTVYYTATIEEPDTN